MKPKKPNKKVIREWVRLLRDGKKKQTIHCLRADNRFCATGLLCEMFRKSDANTSKLRWKMAYAQTNS